MPDTDPAPTTAATDARLDPFARIVEIARRAPSRSRYMSDVLRAVGSCFVSPYAALHVRYSSEVLQDDCHFGPTNPGFWKDTVQDFLTESLTECRSRARLMRSKRGATQIALLSSPIYDVSGSAIGAIALVTTGVDESKLTERLATLDALCRLASFSAAFVGRGAGGGKTPGVPDRNAARAAGYSSPVELAFTITNELRNKLACEQVALGIVQCRRVRLLSISGFDRIARQSPGVAALQSAMEECLDAGEAISHARTEEWSKNEPTGPDYALHRQWHKAAGGAAVASMPLRVGEDIVAILSLRNRTDCPFKAATLSDVRDRTEPFMPALQLLNKAHRSLVRHGIDSVRQTVGSVLEPGRWGRRIAFAGLALGLGWFCFGTMTYDVTAACVVKPARVRHVAATSHGILTEAYVVAGDPVTKGQLLCRFDDRDLRLEQTRLRAEWDVLERQIDRAMSANAPVEAKLAQANQALVEAKLEIVERRIARTELRAPFDGVVTSGDLRMAVGSVMEHGTPLFTVAALDEWSIEINVPEYASVDVGLNLGGTFAPLAEPEHRHPFTVERVIPRADVREGKNVFVAEARFRPTAGTLKPGMEGVASIEIAQRRVWWVALHRIIDYVRLKLWL